MNTLILTTGIALIPFLTFTAISFRVLKLKMIWHKRSAYTTLSIATVHAIAALIKVVKLYFF